jgi:hypothetical protein
VSLDVTATGDVRARRLEGDEAAAASATSSTDGATANGAPANGNGRRLKLAPPKLGEEWVLGEGGFGEGRVGAKALNLKKLASAVPTWIQVGWVGGLGSGVGVFGGGKASAPVLTV